MKKHQVIMMWVAVTIAVDRLASECSGMALCIMLFLMVNSVYSAVLGFYAAGMSDSSGAFL